MCRGRPGLDERYASFNFALGDAFRRAERQLHDEVERMQGEVKVAAEQPIGTVTRLFDDHGFLETAEGLEVYFHRNSVVNGGFAKLEPGTKGDLRRTAGREGTAGKHGQAARQAWDAIRLPRPL